MSVDLKTKFAKLTMSETTVSASSKARLIVCEIPTASAAVATKAIVSDKAVQELRTCGLVVLWMCPTDASIVLARQKWVQFPFYRRLFERYCSQKTQCSSTSKRAAIILLNVRDPITFRAACDTLRANAICIHGLVVDDLSPTIWSLQPTLVQYCLRETRDVVLFLNQRAHLLLSMLTYGNLKISPRVLQYIPKKRAFTVTRPEESPVVVTGLSHVRDRAFTSAKFPLDVAVFSQTNLTDPMKVTFVHDTSCELWTTYMKKTSEVGAEEEEKDATASITPIVEGGCLTTSTPDFQDTAFASITKCRSDMSNARFALLWLRSVTFQRSK